MDKIMFSDSAQARERNIITYAPLASKILEMYCRDCELDIVDIQGMSRIRPLPQRRAHIMLLIMMHTFLSLDDVGKLFFSGRHHSTISHQVGAAKDDIDVDYLSAESHSAWLKKLEKSGFKIMRKKEDLCKRKATSATI